MSIIRAICTFCLVATFASGALAQDIEFSVGQIWEFEAEAPNADALIKIQQVEALEIDGKTVPVFHISMSDLEIDDALMPLVHHLPVSLETLRKSVTLQSDRPFPEADFQAGIAEWRNANGGVFTITLAEIIDVLEQSFAQVKSEN